MIIAIVAIDRIAIAILDLAVFLSILVAIIID